MKQLKMPGDIALICFDDHELFHLFPGGITAVEQPIFEIGKTAIQLLMKQLDRKPKSSHDQLLLSPRLIVRGST